MSIDVPLSVRAAEEGLRVSSREAAVQHVLSQADAKRDQRVEEAKESAAARSTPAERAAEAPPRKSSGSRMVDLLA